MHDDDSCVIVLSDGHYKTSRVRGGAMDENRCMAMNHVQNTHWFLSDGHANQDPGAARRIKRSKK